MYAPIDPVGDMNTKMQAIEQRQEIMFGKQENASGEQNAIFDQLEQTRAFQG